MKCKGDWIMETMTQIRQNATVDGMKIAAPMVKPGAARMRELTPAQRRAVVLAQQQVMKARAAKKAKDEAAEMRRRMWRDEESGTQAVAHAEAKPTEHQEDTLSLRGAIGLVLRDLRSRDHKTLRGQREGRCVARLSFRGGTWAEGGQFRAAELHRRGAGRKHRAVAAHGGRSSRYGCINVISSTVVGHTRVTWGRLGGPHCRRFTIRTMNGLTDS